MVTSDCGSDRVVFVGGTSDPPYNTGDCDMLKRKTAIVSWIDNGERMFADVSYHRVGDLKQEMQALGLHHYKVKGVVKEDSPSPWEPAELPVAGMLNLTMLVLDLA